MVPNVIDIEASGFGAGSYPIEVGVVLESGKTVCNLIRPESEWEHWDKNAEALHGIERPLLFKNGQPVKKIAQILNSVLEGKTVYTDGWGVDNTWLSLLYYHAGMHQSFRLETIRILLSEEQVIYWHPTKDRITQELDLKRHRASSDALVLQKTFLQTVGMR